MNEIYAMYKVIQWNLNSLYEANIAQQQQNSPESLAADLSRPIEFIAKELLPEFLAQRVGNAVDQLPTPFSFHLMTHFPA